MKTVSTETKVSLLVLSALVSGIVYTSSNGSTKEMGEITSSLIPALKNALSRLSTDLWVAEISIVSKL